MRWRPVILVTGMSMACGGSQNVCQQAVSLVQSESNRVQSCPGTDAADNAFGMELGSLQDGGLQSCEASLPSCTSTDLSALSSALDCEQSLVGTIQCQWFTEGTAAASDPTLASYESATKACAAKAADVTPACGGVSM